MTGSLRAGSVLRASTKAPNVAVFTDNPPTDHDHRRRASDTLPDLAQNSGAQSP